MSTEETKAKKATSKWKMDLFKRFVAQAERVHHLLHISMRGISVIRGMPKVIDALAKYESLIDKPDSGSKKRVVTREQAEEMAKLAESEVDQGFPILHAQAAVNLWAMLDALIHSYLCEWIIRTPMATSTPPLSKIRVNLGEYEKLRRQDQVAFIIELLEKEIATGIKYGVKRFETLLEVCDLSGRTSPSVKRDLFELAQIRNIVVHRNGIADHHFIESCPWLKVVSGQEVVISHNMFQRYMEAVHIYVAELICRAAEREGVNMAESRAGLNKRKHGRVVLANKSMKPTLPPQKNESEVSK